MRFLKKILSRVFLFSLGIFLQLAWLFLLVFLLSEYYLPIALLLTVISIAAALFIVGRPGNPAIKMAWVVPILVFPLFGGILFLISGGKGPKRKLKKALDKSFELIKPYAVSPQAVEREFSSRDEYIKGQCYYLESSGFPLYENTAVDYDDNGKDAWLRIIEDLKKAEKFIFMEYFIIKHGVMWQTILDILKEKAAAGVDVRLIYDDMGNISVMPRKYAKELASYGIKCHVFNRYRPVYSVVMNHRDHRKILVIDGHTAYTGGINFSDEYIGAKDRCGEWKDNSIRLHGEGVRSMTLLFLHMWNAVCLPEQRLEDIDALMPKPEDVADVTCPGVVQPYGDSPVDSEPLAENVYLNIINQSTKYCYIFTPYVIIDQEMMRALCLAAKRGVDVRMVVPEIPDKKIVYHLTLSHLPELMESGVKVYKFTPGFVHSKSFVADDRIAVVGSINTDYRSLYHHFENACLFVDHPVIMDVKKDFEDTFPVCEEQKVQKHRMPLLYDVYLSILKLFAPLM